MKAMNCFDELKDEFYSSSFLSFSDLMNAVRTG